MWQPPEDTIDNLEALQTLTLQGDTTAELVGIKTILQGIALDMGALKANMETTETTIEKLGFKMSDVETSISYL